MKAIAIAGVMAVYAAACVGAEIQIRADGSGDYATIQAAIDAAAAGDVIILSPGFYKGPGNRDLDPVGKAVTIRSAAPRDPNVVKATVIDCQGDAGSPHRGFRFRSGEGPSTIIEGLQVASGCEWSGGAVYCSDGSSPSVVRCLLTDNAAVDSGGAIAADNSSPLIEECTISGNRARRGGAVCGNFSGIKMRNCHITGNHASESGGAIHLAGLHDDDQPRLTNCLVIANMAGRDGGAISANWYANPRIANCTIVDNWATGQEAADQEGFGGGLYCASEADVSIVDSILWGNWATQGRQVAVSSGFGYDAWPSSATIAFSAVQGGFNQTAVLVAMDCTLHEANNVFGDPLFVTGPFGDYYLMQRAAGQPAHSPCVDAGSDWAATVGMNKYTTRSDVSFAAADKGRVDIGYHYPIRETSPACQFCDVYLDGIVDIYDLAEIACRWLSWYDADLGAADLNEDGIVDMADVAILAICWSAEDREPPMPAVAQWQMRPRSSGLLRVEMAAEPAVDAWWGDRVAYRFVCFTHPACSSAWQQNYSSQVPGYRSDPTAYSVYGLHDDEQYGFVVQVRDLRGNVTADSEPAYVIPGVEDEPPLVDGNPQSQWATPPYATSATSVRMVAEVPFDQSLPIEYYFMETDAHGAPAAGGHDSGWKSSAAHEVFGLVTGVTYYFRVTTRDRYGNMSDLSPVAAVMPSATAVDDSPPVPDPPMWSIQPLEFWAADGMWWHYMAVEPVVDVENNGVEYFFDCLYNSSWDSGWRSDATYLVAGVDYPVESLRPAPNEYWVRVGANGVKFSYRVMTRDQSGNQNESGWTAVMTIP